MSDPKIKIKRSAVAGKIPTPDQVPLGEIAINTYDGYLYASKNVGIGTTVIVINPFKVGAGTDSYDAYFTAGNVGIGSTLPTSKLDVDGNVNATSFSGSGINLTGIVTSITAGSGISVDQSTGNVTITATSSGGGGSVTIKDEGSVLGTAVTSVNFVGSGVSASGDNSEVTITISNTSEKYGEVRILDDISASFNGVTTSFSITSGGGVISPQISSSQSLIVNLGGILQKPVTDYYISENNIFFTTPPQTGLSFSGVHFDLNLLGTNGQILILDDISTSFNGVTTSFPITSNSGSISPSNSQSLLVSIGGIIQSPSSDYSVSGSNIIFTTPPLTELSFFGTYFDVNASDNKVTPNMLSVGGPWWNNNGNVGVGTTDATSKLTVYGDVNISGVTTALSFSGSGINLTGIVTSITAGSGISVDQSTGNVTITASGGGSDITIKDEGTIIGTAATTFNFVGSGVTVTYSGGVVDVNVSGGGGNLVTRTVSSTTATEGQTTFDRTYDVGYIDVYLNGARLDSSEFTATNGTSVVLNTGTTANDVIETVSYESVGIASDYSSTAGVATYATTAGIATYATTAGIATYATTAGISTLSQGLSGTPNINVGIVTASQITGISTISGIGTDYNDAVKFTNSSGTENGQLCKAWVNFNGTGTVAIRGSFNVSSITDNGTGDYTINFANAFPDANYAYSHAYSSEVAVQHTLGFLNAYSEGALNIIHFSDRNSNDRVDKGHVFISVFR